MVDEKVKVKWGGSIEGVEEWQLEEITLLHLYID